MQNNLNKKSRCLSFVVLYYFISIFYIKLINPGLFAPWVIALSDVFEPEFFVIAYVVGTKVKVLKPGLSGVCLGFVNQQRAVIIASVLLLDINGGYPRPEIHTADKIVGDEPCAANYLAIFFQ